MRDRRQNSALEAGEEMSAFANDIQFLLVAASNDDVQ
jgi:hypothetical protein